MHNATVPLRVVVAKRGDKNRVRSAVTKDERPAVKGGVLIDYSLAYSVDNTIRVFLFSRVLIKMCQFL
jgi:hypothetical protein